MVQWKTDGCSHVSKSDYSVKASDATQLAKGVYEASVKARGLARAGHCLHSNGHVLEIMAGDKVNLNPANWLAGKSHHLTQSTTAKTVDAVVMKGGKVLERIQYKDTPHSIGEVVRKVQSGQYRTATLKGTSETAKTFNAYAEKHGLKVRMEDAGISSKSTKALARSMGSCPTVSLHQAAWHMAKHSGAVGAVVGGGISAVRNIFDVINGEKDGVEALGCIAKDTAGAGVVGMASGYAATVAGAGAAAACTALGVTGAAAAACTIGAPIAAVVGVGYLVGKIWSSIFD